MKSGEFLPAEVGALRTATGTVAPKDVRRFFFREVLMASVSCAHVRRCCLHIS